MEVADPIVQRVGYLRTPRRRCQFACLDEKFTRLYKNRTPIRLELPVGRGGPRETKSPSQTRGSEMTCRNVVLLLIQFPLLLFRRCPSGESRTARGSAIPGLVCPITNSFLFISEETIVTAHNDFEYGRIELEAADELDWRRHPCRRDCVDEAPPMECHYIFKLEAYHTMSKACYDCPFNVTDCFRPHCVPADGVERSVLVVNRQMPGPPIEVCSCLFYVPTYELVRTWTRRALPVASFFTPISDIAVCTYQRRIQQGGR